MLEVMLNVSKKDMLKDICKMRTQISEFTATTECTHLFPRSVCVQFRCDGAPVLRPFLDDQFYHKLILKISLRECSTRRRLNELTSFHMLAVALTSS